MSVTAIIVCMTKEDYPFIREALSSVLRQTVPCRIILMVSEDDDSVEQVLGDLLLHVIIKRTALRPVGIVRNLGVAAADTEWVAFLDGDDVWLPDKIERQLAFAAAHSLLAVGVRHVLIRADGTPYFYAFARTMPMPSAWMAKRELMTREPFLDVMQFEDAELWARWKRLGISTLTMRAHLIQYRVRENSLSSSFSPAKQRKQRAARIAAFWPLRWALRGVSRVASLVVTPKEVSSQGSGNGPTRSGH